MFHGDEFLVHFYLQYKQRKLGSYIKKNFKFLVYAGDMQTYHSIIIIAILNDSIGFDLTNVFIFSEAQMLLFGIRISRATTSNVLRIKLNNNLGIIIEFNVRFRERLNKLIRGAFEYLKLLYYSQHLFSVKVKKKCNVTACFYLNLIMFASNGCSKDS